MKTFLSVIFVPVTEQYFYWINYTFYSISINTNESINFEKKQDEVSNQIVEGREIFTDRLTCLSLIRKINLKMAVFVYYNSNYSYACKKGIKFDQKT